MNFQLLRQRDGQWSYDAPEQDLVAQSAREVLQWDLLAFDSWVHDSRNWTMYTRERQRLIALRDELAIQTARHLQSGEPLTQSLALHCIHCWRLVRNSKSIPQELLWALAQACKIAQGLAVKNKLSVKLRIRGSRPSMATPPHEAPPRLTEAARLASAGA